MGGAESDRCSSVEVTRSVTAAAELRGRQAIRASVSKRFDGLEMGGPHSRVGARKQAYQTT
jgi:hypothetical protein